MRNQRTNDAIVEASPTTNTVAEIANLHHIESNPLTADDVQMFEMFEREGWSGEKCRAHILKLAEREVAVTRQEEAEFV